MVIFQYNLYIFGIHLWTVLYTKLCYKESCYKEVVVYISNKRMKIIAARYNLLVFLFLYWQVSDEELQCKLYTKIPSTVSSVYEWTVKTLIRLWLLLCRLTWSFTVGICSKDAFSDGTSSQLIFLYSLSWLCWIIWLTLMTAIIDNSGLFCGLTADEDVLL